MLRILAAGVVAGALAAVATPLRAQEPDPGEAYGVYRPPPPPAPDTASAPSAAVTDTGAAGNEPGRVGVDTLAQVTDVQAALAVDSAARDTAAADTAGAPPVLLDHIEEPAEDTSLTARMDVSRGGGLSRAEFPDLRETARLTGRYGVFLELMARSGYAAALTDSAALTVLAPTDSAFARLPAGELARLRGDSTALAAWAASVLVNGDRRLVDLLGAGEATSAGGATVRVERGDDGTPRVGEARLVQPDLVARNGRLHGVDRVLLPRVDSATSAAP